MRSARAPAAARAALSRTSSTSMSCAFLAADCRATIFWRPSADCIERSVERSCIEPAHELGALDRARGAVPSSRCRRPSPSARRSPAPARRASDAARRRSAPARRRRARGRPAPRCPTRSEASETVRSAFVQRRSAGIAARESRATPAPAATRAREAFERRARPLDDLVHRGDALDHRGRESNPEASPDDTSAHGKSTTWPRGARGDRHLSGRARTRVRARLESGGEG